MEEKLRLGGVTVQRDQWTRKKRETLERRNKAPKACFSLEVRKRFRVVDDLPLSKSKKKREPKGGRTGT